MNAECGHPVILQVAWILQMTPMEEVAVQACVDMQRKHTGKPFCCLCLHELALRVNARVAELEKESDNAI